MGDLVAGKAKYVFDGQKRQRVYDRNIIRDHKTVTVVTRRGIRLEGSDNHRVLLADGETWKRMDELVIGDKLQISGGGGMWPEEQVRVDWTYPGYVSLQDVADEAGVSIDTVLRYRAGSSVEKEEAISSAMQRYDEQTHPMSNLRKPVNIPAQVSPELAAFLGYLIGDGHISRVKRQLGLTSGDDSPIEHFTTLSEDLFGLIPSIRRDGTRWRAILYAESLSNFLIDGLGLTHGPSASEKTVPAVILRSPEPVVRAFLRAYFDCDAYAGRQGVILSTANEEMARQVQLLLLNYDILCRIRRQTDGVYHLHISGKSAALYAEKVGFGLRRKQHALEDYVADRKWFLKEKWEDEVVALEAGRADVYDISVTETHRYAAGGLINHNSYWHTRMMTHDILEPSEFIEYADHHSGTVATRPGQFNPYKLGLELYRHIERRWDKGQFGKDYQDCDDWQERKRWDTGAMLGRQKIFECRRVHNDVTFIDEYLTEDFVREQGLFTWEYDKNSGEYVISSRDFHQVKQRLLFMLSNRGQPRVAVIDGNHANRGELVLAHTYEGMDIQLDWAEQTMRNLVRIWGRPVHMETMLEGKPHTLHHDGDTFKKERVKKGK